MLQLSIRPHIFEAFPKSLIDRKERLWYRTTFKSYTMLLVEHNFCTRDFFDTVLSLSSSCPKSSYTLLLIKLCWHRSQYISRKGVFCQK